MRALNRTYRHKNAPTDILAFPLDRTHGEILMCKSMIAKKAKIFGMRTADYVRYLFIHGALHLKGRDHGRIMTRSEDRWCRMFGIPAPRR
jgi:rRNA maturation RNase YbeY